MTGSWWRAGVLLVAVALWTPALRAGQPEPSPGRPTFRSGTAAVLLDIVVRDRRGRPVRDLRPEEVRVLEDGEPREIQSFRLIEGAEAPSVLDVPEAVAAAPDPLRRVTLVSLVFDRLGQSSRRLAAQAALDFVSRELPEGQWVAVFVLDGRVRRLQDFTRRSEELRAAVQRAAAFASGEEPAPLPGSSRERASPDPYSATTSPAPSGGGAPDGAALGSSMAERAIAEVTSRIQMFADSAELQQRGQSTLFPLMALARAQASLEGRKAILLFSEGFQVPVNMEEAFRATISEANRANVSFYAVDARGLDTARALEDARAALNRAGRTSQQEMLKRGAGPVTMEEVMNAETAQSALGANIQAKLEELAESTGGFLIGNSNDLRRGLEKVTGDLASYYEIAYTPGGSELDGRFRKLEVKVERRGVNVQARSGYFALPATDGAPLMPYELPLLGALTVPQPPRAFEYRAGAFAFHDTPRGRHHTLLVEVPLEHLTFEEDARSRQYHLRFAVMAAVKDASGRMVERMSNAFPLEGPLERLPALKLGNVVFRRQLWLPPGTYRIGVVAHDQATDRTSVRELPVDVPAPRTGVHLSTPAIIRRVDPAGEAPDPVEDPFRAGPVRIVPSLDTPISKAANSQISAFIVVYPDTSEPARPELTLEFTRDGVVTGRGSPALSDPDEQGRVSYVATFPSDGFHPGTYELRAVVRQGSTQDESRTSFTVVP